MALCTTSACAMYIHLLPQLAEHGVRFHDVAPTGLHYSSAVWSEFFAGGFWGWPTAALLALAAYTAIRRSNGICLLLVLVSLAPVFLSVQGVSHFPWGYSRYLIFTLPLLIVIVSWGLASLPIVAERPRLLLALALGLGLTWIPNLATEFAVKRDYPWDAVRASLGSSTTNPNLVIGLDRATVHNWGPSFMAGPVTHLARLEKDSMKVDGITGPRSLNKIVLLVRDVTPECAEGMRFGKITALVFEPTPYEVLVREIRSCLLQTVAGSWPTEPEYAAIYSGIVSTGRELRIRHREQMYVDLAAVASERQRQSLWKTPTMRRLDAETRSLHYRRLSGSE